MAEKTDVVIYIDRSSVAHKALVVGVNNLNPDVLDVAYFDLKADALKTEFGVPHMSDESKKETNPDLPQYSLNCWKKYYEEHLALPTDHPANDHPFELKKQDDSGRLIAKARPEFRKHIEEHQAGRPQDEPSLSAEGKAEAERTGEVPLTTGQKPQAALVAPISSAADAVRAAAEASIAAEQHDQEQRHGLETGGTDGRADAEAVAEEIHEATGATTEVIDGVPVVDMPPGGDTVVPEPDVSTQLDAAGEPPVVEEQKPPATDGD